MPYCLRFGYVTFWATRFAKAGPANHCALRILAGGSETLRWIIESGDVLVRQLNLLMQFHDANN